MAHQTNDAAPHSSRALPPNPYLRSSPASARSIAASVNLISPSRRARSPPLRKPHLNVGHPRPTTSNRRSAAEKRLVGDFDVPADRVYAPDPTTYFPGPTRTAMAKPGQANAFTPVNTIDRVTRGPVGGKHVVYGKQSRRLGPNGMAPGPGQTAYIGRSWGKSSTTPTRNASSREEAASDSRRAFSSKRRKTEHVAPDQVIDLVDDDDVQEVSPGFALTALTICSNDVPRSAQSAQSRHSDGSGRTLTASRSGSQPKSEFQTTDDIIDPRRKKARISANIFGGHRSDVARTTTSHHGRSVSGSVTPHLRDAPITIQEDEPAALAGSTRRVILQECQQGESIRAPAECDAASHKHEAVTSHRFQKARINESTEQTANARRTEDHSSSLRTFRRADNRTLHGDTISDDELAMEMPMKKAPVIKRNRSPSRPSQLANSGARRKHNSKAISKAASEGWPLLFARTHDFERLGGVETDHGCPDLILRSHSEEGTWCITEFDPAIDGYIDRVYINSKDVNKSLADDVGHMRLEGPRGQDGNCHIYDLTFASTENYRIFCDEHVESLIRPGKIFQKPEKAMKTLFSKSLVRNDKVGTTPLVNDSPLVDDAKNGIWTRSSRTPLYDQLRAGSQSSLVTAATNNSSKVMAAPLRNSTRSARSTRSSAPTHDVDEPYQDQDVEKYSVKTGLGHPWKRPLTYGEGRQKATVFFDDLSRLDEEEFMNDSLIDFYMIYLFDKSSIPKDKVFFFNTYFFTKLTKNTGRESMNYKAVERWTSKIDIFSYDYIVVPINEATHWYLAIICNVANIDRKPVEDDLDNNLIEDVADDSNNQPDQVEATVNETSDALQLVGATSEFPKLGPSEPGDNDANLFDEQEQEQSKLDLIDREDTGTEDTLHQRAIQPESVPKSPQGEDIHATESASFSEATSTVLTNLKASTEKKNGKRKPMLPKKDPNQPVIMILDSLGQTRSPTVRALKDWLAAEGKTKRGMEAIIKEKGFYPKASQIPMQDNWTDCGVYLLGYVDKFFRNPDEFKNRLLTGEMSAAEDWPELRPRDMRNNLRDIIFKLANEQKLTEKKTKVKKAPATARVPPSNTKSEPANLDIKLPPKKQAELNEPRAEQFEAASTRVTKPRPSQLDQHLLSESPKPGLGSPFKPRLASTEFATYDKSPGAVGKVSDSPPVTLSPAKPKATTPHLENTPRRWDPEVRIPVKALQSQLSLHNGHAAVNEDTHADDNAHRARTAGASNDDWLRLPPVTGRAVKSSPADREQISSSTSPFAPRYREGSLDHPIEIMDSQDVKPMAAQSPRRLQTDSPAQRRAPTQTPRNMLSLRLEPSLEEIPSPLPRVAQRKHCQPNEGVIGRQLEAMLDEQDAERKGFRRYRERLPAAEANPSYLERAEESEPDFMEVDS